MSAIHTTGAVAAYAVRNAAFLITDGLVLFSKVVTGTTRHHLR